MFKSWIQAVKLGSAYRLKKYGSEETISESYASARKHVVWEQENIHTKTKFYWPWTNESAEYCKQQDDFKSHFAFWDEWTGSRYERIENPDFTKVKDRFSVCRSNAVTGEWEKL